jgi:hypothetical protein
LLAEWKRRPSLRQWAVGYFSWDPDKQEAATNLQAKLKQNMQGGSPALTEADDPYTNVIRIGEWLKNQPNGEYVG